MQQFLRFSSKNHQTCLIKFTRRQARRQIIIVIFNVIVRSEYVNIELSVFIVCWVKEVRFYYSIRVGITDCENLLAKFKKVVDILITWKKYFKKLKSHIEMYWKLLIYARHIAIDIEVPPSSN